MNDLTPARDIPEELEPLQRLHYAILTQARMDWKAARRMGYVSTSGDVQARRFRYKKGRKRKELRGSFNCPTSPDDIRELAAFWRGRGAQRAMRGLGAAPRDGIAALWDAERCGR